jgi:hypothetical protein
MKTKINEIAGKSGIGTDVSGRWYSTSDVDKLSSLIIEECILAVKNCNRNHGATTFDKGIIDKTIDESVKSIKTTFNIA